MVLDASTTIRRSPRVEYRSLGEGEGGVLLRLDNGAYHGLNETGALIWRLLNGVTFGELLAAMRDQLEDAPAGLADEVTDFLNHLAARGLVMYSTARAKAQA
jgi:hypothetical protein